VCAAGLVALKSGFTGPAVDLTSTVSGASTTTTVNILAGGELDIDAVRAVFSAADAGTFVYATKVYDQSGAGNHLTYVASAGKVTRGLYVLWDPKMGRYVLGADQNYGSQGQSLSFPGTLSVREDQLGAFFFGRGVGSLAPPNTQIVASFGSGANAISIHTGENAVGPTIAGWNNGGRIPPSNKIVPLLSGPCVASYIGNPAGVQLSVNETSEVFAASNPRVVTGGMLGYWDLAGGKFAAMRYVGVVIANVTPTAAQQEKIRRWFYTKFDTAPQARDRVVFISDSRGTLVNSDTCNSTGQAGANIGVQLAEYLKSDAEVINCSTSGWTNENHRTQSIPGLVAGYRTGTKNIAVILLGVNDFLASALTPAQSLAALNTNIGLLQAAGYHVKVVSELRCTTSTNNSNIYVDELRMLIEAGGTTANEVISVSDLTPVNTPLAGQAPFYYPDGLHPGAAVSGLVAQRIATSVDKTLST